MPLSQAQAGRRAVGPELCHVDDHRCFLGLLRYQSLQDARKHAFVAPVSRRSSLFTPEMQRSQRLLNVS